MTTPFRRRITLWIALALPASAALTWREWVTHHPPEILIIAVLHFVVVLAALMLSKYIVQWIARKQR